MKETKEFKTETKRLLELMIHSIYTNKEIFLRELISNASDAIDKRHFLSLTNDKIKNLDYEIIVEAKKDINAIVISDNGIGMNKEDLEKNLGTIAKSGSLEFLEKIEKENKKDVDIIGQFGVGFYSSFIVAKEVEVVSRKAGSNKTYKFTSHGLESYDIEETDEKIEGTRITLYLRDDTKDFKYSEFLQEDKIVSLIKKYSDYIRYKILTYVTKKEDKKEELVLEVINSQKPIWKKKKSEVKEEELNEFYKQKFFDFQDPLKTIRISVEGLLSYDALLYIPRKQMFLRPDNNERGLELYTKGVFILEKCKDLIPEYLYFVKGLVDSSDLPLNISREILQEDKEIKKISVNIEKKIISELSKMMKNEKDLYNEFYDTYKENLKFALYQDTDKKKSLLEDLLLFRSSKNNLLISFDEYVSNMKENQEFIYYISLNKDEDYNNVSLIKKVNDLGYDVLICYDEVDEFLFKNLEQYKEKKFKSIKDGDVNFLTDDKKEEITKLEDENKDLLQSVKDVLKDEVNKVIISKRLLDEACYLTSDNEISLKMEQALKKQNGFVKASKVLELNPNHVLFEKLKDYSKNDAEKFKMLVELIYDESLIIEGLEIKDKQRFSKNLESLLSK